MMQEEKSKPDDAMMQEDCGEAIEKRGTKRSVKERLGAKKIQLDRFHNETLPAPGEPRQIVDIAEISLVEGSDQDFGEEVAERLKEDKEEMMVDLVKAAEASEGANAVLQIDNMNADAIFVRGLCLYYEDNVER